MKMNARHWLIIMSFVCFTACGGGGGGGAKSSAKAVNSSSAQSSSILASSSTSSNSSEAVSQSSTSSAPIVVNRSPTVNVLFPRQNARTERRAITVQGTATDDRGISSIKVNGVVASFQIAHSVADLAKQSSDDNIAQTIGALDKSDTEGVVVNWAATIPLMFGQTDILVEVTDTDGESTQNLDKPIQVNNARLPLAIIKDRTNHRFIGVSQYPEIFSIDMTSLAMTRLPDTRYEQGFSLSTDSSKIFSVTNDGGKLKVYSSKIATGLISLEAEYDLQFDSARHNWISVDGTLSTDSKYYFVLAVYAFHDNSTENKILKVNLDTRGVEILSEKSKPNSMFRNVSEIVYVDNYLIGASWRNINSNDLIKIDSETGKQEVFMENLNFDSMSITDNRESLYLLSNKGFSVIRLADKGVTNTSFAKQADMLEFAQKNSFLVDEDNNRLVVGDSGLWELVTVDITTGERKFLKESGIGDGPKLVWPNQLAVTSDEKFAYVLDDRLDATEMLFKIDLTTGNREVISDLSAYAQDNATALVLDEAKNRVFVAFGLTIGVVDLTTGEHKIIADQSIGLGPMIKGIGDMVYDETKDRLLVTDLSQAFIVAIDLKSNIRSVLFDETIGAGLEFTPMSSIALDRQSNQLYVSTAKFEGENKVIAIDLLSGNRSLLFDHCEGHRMTYKHDANLQLDTANTTLTILANNEVFKYDLERNSCAVLPVSVSDIAYLSDTTTLLGVDAHGLYQINPSNGERVAISR